MKAIMVCHTHWDREWYFTREVFRTKLVRLIDGLLEILDSQPEYVSFMLDGQTIVLEDYLEIRPKNRERLMDAVKKGRIVCGPWYVLPDELLVSGEAHIRNALTGANVLEGWGRKMKIAYLPDSFGHPAQMPQIVKGLGMEAMFFWRGAPGKLKSTEFYWESPCGGEGILCVHMPNGYGNCGNLSSDMEITKGRVENLLRCLGEGSTVSTVLLMNGSDHITAQENIVPIVKELNRLLPEDEIRLGTLEDFLEEVKKELGSVPALEGELCSGERSMLLGGTLSSRMELKQENHRVQKKMERYLEPMLAGEKLLGSTRNSRGFRDYLWKKILENHPHDSICGCSIDEVHREMKTRFACVGQLQDRLLLDAAQSLSSGNRESGAEDTETLFLFEPSQDGLPSWIETEVCMDRRLVQAVNFTTSIIEDYEAQVEHPPIPENLEITDETGRRIPFVLLEAKKDYETLYQDHTMPEIYKVNRMRLGLLLPGFAPGFHTLSVRRAAGRADTSRAVSENLISNEFYEITARDGAFDVLDKRTGRIYRGVARLLDGGDAGDEYTYSWPEKDRIAALDGEKTESEVVRLGDTGAALTIKGILKLPEGLTQDRKERSGRLVQNEVSIRAELHPGIPRIDFTVELDNHAKDHRLQVHLPSGIRTEESQAYHTFAVVSRPVEEEIPKTWLEYPQTTHPHHGFVSLEDGNGGLCAGAEGLPEFEAVQGEEDTCLRFTLLRCVGWLSRTDLLTRKGNGGWTIETPEAQCQGRYRFRFCASYYSGTWRETEGFGFTEKFLHPAWTAPGAVSENPLEFLKALPKDIRLSALKEAEDGRGILLRLYSVAKEERRVELALPEGVAQAEETNLAEEFCCGLSVEEGRISFCMKPSQIRTIRLLRQ